MKRHFFVRGSVPTLIVATALLSGCGWFHRDRADYYKGTQETRPLEVPPDLDAPPTSRELVVPGSATAAGASSVSSAQLGKVASKDDAAHSYAYDFDGTVTTKPAAPQEHHWYSRILHPFGGGGDKAQTQSVKAALRVNVTDDAGGARISVVPAPGDKSGEAAAQRVIAALRERLS